MPDVFTSSKKEDIKSQPPVQTGDGHIKPHIHHFASFCDHPKGISFQDQKKGEEVLLLLRKHFITNFPWIFTTVVLLILPPLLWSLIKFLLLSSFPALVLNPVLTFILISFYYLSVLTYAFISFITWFYNVSLVTNQRVIDIDFSDLVYHNLSATKISLVQDVNYTQVGFIPSFFNYGDVFVQTAAENPNFDFLSVPKPATVVSIIENLIGGESNVP